MPDDKYELGEDGFVREIVGEWTRDKHEFIKRYITITGPTRRKFREGFSGSSTYIDLFCGPGQSRIRDTTEVIDGSPLVAFRSALRGGQPFTAVHLGDLNSDAVVAATHRITAVGGNVTGDVGPAQRVARRVVDRVNRYGLHFALLDPYKLESLTFETIRTLSELNRIDMLLHVSAMDLQRNLDAYGEVGERPFDLFAPGWRTVVDLHQGQAAARAALLNYWCSLVEGLGFSKPRYELIKGPKNQRLYWLAFISREPIANEFWEKIRYTDGQSDLFSTL